MEPLQILIEIALVIALFIIAFGLLSIGSAIQSVAARLNPLHHKAQHEHEHEVKLDDYQLRSSLQSALSAYKEKLDREMHNQIREEFATLLETQTANDARKRLEKRHKLSREDIAAITDPLRKTRKD